MPAAYPPSPRPRLQLGFPEHSGFSPILNFFLPLPQVPLMTGQPGPGHGKKLGHRGVDASGETTYKKVPALPSVNGGGTRGPRHMCTEPTEGQVWAVCGWRLHHLPGSSSHCGLD